jgi:hypothetical protein
MVCGAASLDPARAHPGLRVLATATAAATRFRPDRFAL